MGFPVRIPRVLNGANLLDAMRPGHAYTAWYLAGRFKVKAEEVTPVLKELIAVGKVVEVSSDDSGKKQLRQYKTTEQVVAAVVEEAGPFALATRPITILLTGQLSGWEAAMNKRRDLCMLARGGR